MTDARTLAAAVTLDGGSFFQRTNPNNDSHIIGRFYGFPQSVVVRQELRGLSKSDLEKIVQGYPPFYRENFRAHSGVEVPHPMKQLRDACRAGWVVAIGFRAHSPTPLYNNGCSSMYTTACDRVAGVFQRLLLPAFGNHLEFGRKLKVALSGIEAMNKHRTGSVLARKTWQEIFGDASVAQTGECLTLPDIRLTLRLFNDPHLDSLSESDCNMLEIFFCESLKAALFGVYSWWQYVNNQGHAIPEWLLREDTRHHPIWLEDHDEVA